MPTTPKLFVTGAAGQLGTLVIDALLEMVPARAIVAGVRISPGKIETEIAALMEFRDKPAGKIRIRLSDHALNSLVWPKLRPVLASYPDIKLEFSVDNGLRNIIEDGFDAGIRLGESVEKDMIAIGIGPDWRMVAVASPLYLEAHTRRPIPKT